MKRGNIFVSSLAVCAIGLLYLPMLAVGAMSFNASRLGVQWQGFTLHWYRQLLDDPQVLHAARNTFLLAAISSVIATILGTFLAMGIDRFPWPAPMRRMLDTVLYLPVVMPDLIFAAALLVVFRGVRELLGFLEPGLGTMIIAHVTFEIAFVALIVRSRLATIDPKIEEAARDLYAGTFTILRRILLPLIFPAILGGFLLAFTLSVDDFVVSFFTSGPDSVTLPLYIYSSVKRGVSPELHAMTMVIFFATILLVLAVMLVVRDPRSASGGGETAGKPAR